MFKLVVVLFALNSVLWCHARIVKDYERSGNSYDDLNDGPSNRVDYGFSKKSKYNRIVVTTYLAPVPEEVAESYSSYVVHPADNKRCGYNNVEDKASQASEDSANMASSLKLYPIVVEEIEEGNTPEEDKSEYDEAPEKSDELNNDNNNQGSYREWFFRDEPKQGNVLDDETREFFRKWFEKEEPKSTALEYWKNFKDQFDAFYEEFKQSFDVDYQDDDEKDGDQNNKENYEDWFAKTPQEYQYEDKNDDTGETWGYHFVQDPKYNYERKYYHNSFDNDYGQWNKW